LVSPPTPRFFLKPAVPQMKVYFKFDTKEISGVPILQSKFAPYWMLKFKFSPFIVPIPGISYVAFKKNILFAIKVGLIF